MKIWGIIGTLVSASSIFSLLQHGFDFPLTMSFSDFLNYYRELVIPIYQFLYQPIYWIFGDINIPNWISDAQTLSIVATSIYVKTKSSKIVNGEQVHFKSFWSKIITIIVSGISLIGLFFIPIILLGMIMFPIYYINHLRWYNLKWYKFNQVLRSIYIGTGSKGAPFNTSAIYGYLTILVVIVFYLWNKILL